MHCLEVCLVAYASTYTHEHIYVIHVLVIILRGSMLCDLRKTIHKQLYSCETCSRIYVHELTLVDVITEKAMQKVKQKYWSGQSYCILYLWITFLEL